jgi:hypothetical protein
MILAGNSGFEGWNGKFSFGLLVCTMQRALYPHA